MEIALSLCRHHGFSDHLIVEHFIIEAFVHAVSLWASLTSVSDVMSTLAVIHSKVSTHPENGRQTSNVSSIRWVEDHWPRMFNMTFFAHKGALVI